MAAISPFNIGVRWDYDDTGFQKLSTDLDQAGQKYQSTAGIFDKSNAVFLRHVSRMTMAYYSLSNVIEMINSGHKNMAEMIPRIIGLLISLTAQIMLVAGAEKVRAVAHGIANALSGPAGWAIIAGAAVMAAVAIGIASQAGNRASGGPIFRTGLYSLEAGERVSKSNTSSGLTIVITGNSITSEALPKLSESLTGRLRAEGVLK